MIEVGKVVQIKKDVAVVELELKEECSSCSIASFCEMKGGNRCIEAEKIPGIKVGDKVKVEIGATQLLKGAILLFLIPAISFLLGVVIGEVLVEGVIFPLALGSLFLAVTFFILHFFDKKLAGDKNKIRIVAILY